MGEARILEAFRTARTRPAFIPFVMAGDPDLEQTAAVVRALARAGAAIVELGVPYSDPIADGPVLIEAAGRALRAGTTPAAVLDLVRRLRREGAPPIVLLLYANVLFRAGVEDFVRAAAEAGVDGLIVPDLPAEESAAVLRTAEAFDVPFIPLVAPTSRRRLDRILAGRRGFVYVVSSLGVTGPREVLSPELHALIRDVRARTALPVAVGFGISRREQVASLAGVADGAIVGSALVRHLAQGGAVEPWVAALFGPPAGAGAAGVL
ncbi:MAG: tryptophan synthase subunit alpha [Hydrogenibacillus schlegelii]|uniref:Tryptophan synthase alpha chain n=1 Tax=Hydrogenibacillus schlegelii TaxID=1484 RepID=A0A947D2B2_HYDSH|nr:tryptophan synthase subunit alpha [Hydrogenibacillus schlegelii]